MASTALAALAHLGGVLVFLQAPTSGAQGVGHGGIEVALGPAGGAPGSAAHPADAPAETVEAVQPPDASQPSAAPPQEISETGPEAVAPDAAAAPSDAPADAPRSSESAKPATAPAPPIPVPKADEVDHAEIAATPTPSKAAESVADATDRPAIPENAREVPTVAANDSADPLTPEESAPISPPNVETAQTTPPPTETTAAPSKRAPPTPVRKPARPTRMAEAALESPAKPDAPRRQPNEPTPEPETDTPERADTASSRSETAEPSRQAARAGSAGKAGKGSETATESGQSASGGGVPGDRADYFARLQAWLESHKEYPRRARLRRMEGTATLRFVMNREGRVLSYTLTNSSGHDMLDEAVQEMIRRAQPLPAFPDGMEQQRMELEVPVRFALR